jgi:minor extracellular serine protease Vpr
MRSIKFTFPTLLLFLVINLNLFSQGIPAREEAKIDLVYSQYNLTGKDVVIAIIDRGIDYFHTDFIDENGNTRVLYLYDMINPEGANDPDNPYGVGTIFSEDEINSSLESNGTPLSMDRYGHGIATAGIAGGNGSGTSSKEFHGVAPEAKFIIVKAVQPYFPPFDDQPGENAFFDPTYIPIAFQFVADKLDELGMPGVALLNMGSIGGPADGTSTNCRAMNDFVDKGYPLVCGVGDDGGADNHASAAINEGETLELDIQKGEAGNLRFTVWYDEDDRFEVTITRPDNSTEGPFPAPATANDADNRSLTGIAYYHLGANKDFSGATSNRREILMDISGATGTYKIKLKGTTINGSGKFHATLNPSTHGSTNKFLNHVVEGYAINDLSSAEKVISPTDYVVKNDYYDMDGIYRQFTGQGDPGELWIGSSFGPTQDDRQGVDFAACGELLYAAYSPDTWYSHFPHLLIQDGNSKYGIQDAVSAAAPLSTGVIALMLEMNPELTPSKIKEILQQTARSDSFTGNVPNNRWGYGKLDALEALIEVEKSLGINDHKEILALDVYPNPADDYLQIRIDQPSNDLGLLSIYNMLGKQFSDKEIDFQNNSPVDVSNLPAGIYQIRLQTGDKFYTGKFVKK